MTAHQKEQLVCFGRGFDANGLCGRIRAAMTRSYGLFGLGWYEVDDQTSAGTPYVVFCNLNNPGANVTAMYIKLGFGPSGSVQIRYYGWWNSTTHMGWGYWGGHQLVTQDSLNFIYDLRGGPEGVVIQTNYNTSWWTTFIDTWTGLANRVEATSKRGVFATGSHTGDSLNKLFRLNTLTGVVLGTNTDANGWIYFSVVDMTGGNYRVNLYRDSARSLLVGHTGNFVASSTSIQTLTVTADASSGLAGTFQYQGPGVLSTTIAHRFGQTFTVNAGFDLTLNEYYFVTDYENKTTVHFVQLTGISGNELTFNRTVSTANFGPGAVIAAYEHRYMIGGTGDGSMMFYRSQIPYYSVPGNECVTGQVLESTYDSNMMNSTICPTVSGITFNIPLTREAPDYKSRYGVHRIGVLENRGYNNNNVATGRRLLGTLNNTYVTYNNSMNPSNNGRTIGALNYLYFQNASSMMSDAAGTMATLFRDSISLT